MSEIKKEENSDNTKRWGVRKESRSFTHCWWECKMGQPFWKIVCSVLTTNPAAIISFSSCMPVSQRNENLALHKNLYTHFYNSFTYNSRNLETTQMSSMGDWLNKRWYVYTTGYYSATKRSGVTIHATTWTNL